MNDIPVLTPEKIITKLRTKKQEKFTRLKKL